ncbi:MAG TPA: protein kinase [Gemmatimonadales bacterium]|nr:protein kinase [Gemmatimonadales bacterium]
MQPPPLEDVQRAVGDRYEVLALAGAGGMGAVFRARHRTLGHIVAVKVLPPDVAASEMRRKRFQREAALAASLSHPHIVPVYEFDTHEDMTFLIMPFVRGTTLDGMLAEGRRLPLAELLRVTREIGEALGFAHRRGIVHRDVKPSNILIEDDTGRALLTDFGVAHVVRAQTSSLTAPGTPIGTPDYMAPEQAAGSERLDGRADLYSLALVAFEALTGTRPAAGTDRAALARAVRAARADLPAAAAAALVAPLADSPDDRPASASAWLAEIGRARTHRWRRWAAAGAVTVVALTGALRYLCRAHILICRQPPVVTVALMPFDKLGGENLPDRQLMEVFARRLAAAPRITVLSGARVYTEAVRRYGPGPLSTPEADSLAGQLGAGFFIQPSAVFRGSRARLSARLYRTGSDDAVVEADIDAPVDSIADIMTPVGEKVLRPILGRAGGLGPGRTCPAGFGACTAYLKADEAFRRGDHERARALYDEVIAHDSDFAPAYFGRLLVVGQTNPSEETLRQTIAGARLHWSSLERADSFLLAGYVHLLERGDGYRALEDFQAAARTAPGQPYVHFVLGEFYLFFGALFEQSLTEARTEFDAAQALDPKFAPAVANSISLAHLRGDDVEVRRLIQLYLGIDTTSVVAEVVRVVDTLLFRPAERLGLLDATLEQRRFPVLQFLAFQAAQFGTSADSAVKDFATRRVLRALERRAANEYERALALRWAVAADLRAGRPDSARARIARATRGSAAREADAWTVLARVTGLDSLGDWRAASDRLSAWTSSPPGNGDAAAHWLLARVGRDAGAHGAALRRAARPDSAPLPVSLSLDLDARARRAAADTAGALALWDRATRRYAVLSAPFDLLASLWPVRLELARVAAARGDTAAARRACDSFDALVGYVDQAALPQRETICRGR